MREDNNLVNYYEILGVSSDASFKTIKEAYRRQSQTRPDGRLDPAAAQRQEEIELAYEVLGNPVERQEYDFKFYQHQQGSNSDTSQTPRRSLLVRFSNAPTAVKLYLFFLVTCLAGGFITYLNGPSPRAVKMQSKDAAVREMAEHINLLYMKEKQGKGDPNLIGPAIRIMLNLDPPAKTTKAIATPASAPSSTSRPASMPGKS